MNKRLFSLCALGITSIVLASCSLIQKPVVDILITNGSVYTGENSQAQQLDVAICQQVICGLFPRGRHTVKAYKTIDATGEIVSPGFIDPHTHSLEELLSKDKNHNLNYLTQGVTTVVIGNDGEGPVDIKGTVKKLVDNGIGTNVALLVGHGSLRLQVMGGVKRAPTPDELKKMTALLEQGMLDGAIGFSSGLYYVPGSFADTEEVVTLAKVASQYNGIYDTHIRDESTFNIGFLAALDEAIEIADKAKIHLHLAHIKALGVDVWGQSKAAIEKIEQAQRQGISITADQYPWLASGTKLRSAVMPKWVMAGTQQDFHQRLNQVNLQDKINSEISENIRRRGGPESLLITAFKDDALVGLNLNQIAQQRKQSINDTVKQLVQEGEVRVASFNMSANDVERFMVRPWVVTSSDGTDGHPRKYASFPKKYQQYVVQKELLNMADFINRSSTQTANILGLSDRGILQIGKKADVIIWDAEQFSPNANFSTWNNYSSGINYVLVNGKLVIAQGKYLHQLAGAFVH